VTDIARRIIHRRHLAWTFLIASVAMFVVRGPWRALHEGDDFAPAYAAARTWVMGLDPYDGQVLTRVLFASGRAADNRGRTVEGPAVYVPATLVAVAPLAALGWQVSRIMLLLIALALFAAHAPALLRMAALTPGSDDRVWLLGGLFALAPYHTGIALGQLAIPCVSLTVLAIDRVWMRREWTAGMYLGVATLLKPQLAAPFIVYFLLRRNLKAVAGAVLLCTAAMLLGVAWLAIHHVVWFPEWQAAMLGVRGSIEHDPAGPFSPQLVDLRPLLALVMGGSASDLAALVIVLALAVVLLRRARRQGDSNELAIVSCVAILALLAVYHRFYDAAILCLPLAWVARQHDRYGFDRATVAAALCCAVFFIPGAWMLQRWVLAGSVSPAVAHSVFWNAVIIRQQNWALVGLAACLLTAIGAIRSRQPTPALSVGDQIRGQTPNSLSGQRIR
jgi:hypothetical protein